MPNLFFRGDKRPEVGEHIIVRIAFGATVGAVFKILAKSGEVMAKARVKRDLGKEEKYNVPLFVDPRRDDDNPGRERTNTGKNLFDLEIEVTNENERLY